MAAPPERETEVNQGDSSADIRSSKAARASVWVAAAGLLLTGGGLCLQACQTGYAAEQTANATGEAAKSRDEVAKRQARLVNVWPKEPFTDARAYIVVSNRAQNPLSNFRVFVAFAKTVSVDYGIRRWIVMPPCTELTIDLLQIARSFPRTAAALDRNKPHRHTLDYGLMFNDANGQAWTRHPSTSVTYNTWLEYLDGKDRDRSPTEPKYLREAGHVPHAGEPMTLTPNGGTFVVGKPRRAADCVSDPQ